MKRLINKYPILTASVVDYLLKGFVSLEDVERELSDQPTLIEDVRVLYFARRNFKEAHRA